MTDGAPDSSQLDASEWIERFAAVLGVDAPDDATVQVLLELAGVAAHASERVAAPIACYLVGLAGARPLDALATSQTIAAPDAAPGAS